MKSKIILIIVAVVIIIIFAGLYIYSSSQVPVPAQPSAVSSTAPAGGAQGIVKYQSGIRGYVFLGPTCPPGKSLPDPKCYVKPYSTSVAVFRKSDPVSPFATGKSDTEGTFSFNLPPGDYSVGAGDSDNPKCGHPDAIVGPTGYATTTIFCAPQATTTTTK